MIAVDRAQTAASMPDSRIDVGDDAGSVRFRPFLAGDVVQLRLRESQRGEFGFEQPLDMAYGRELAAYGQAWTAIRDGRILCCAGFRETFGTVQAVAWALFADDVPIAAGAAIVRYARRQVAASGYRRLEAIVEFNNGKARNFCTAIGLDAAHVLHNFGLNSDPHLLFERIRDA